jgi:hypothetical protein
MKRSAQLWTLACIITVSSAVYQRMTGPTYPVSGRETVGGTRVVYRLLRSHDTSGDAPVEVTIDDPAASGVVEWKRFNSGDPWTAIPMHRDGLTLSARLPRQPEAGKLEYRVIVLSGQAKAIIPTGGELVMRFKGEVPASILIVHIFCMFAAMLLSTRTGLELFHPEPGYRRLMLWTIGFLAVGGLVLGPIVQKYAFDAYWTGWPVGHDLTDNKTVAALLGWITVAWMQWRGRDVRKWAAGAAVFLLAVYMIPHSVLGSELEYSKTPGVREAAPSSPASR